MCLKKTSVWLDFSSPLNFWLYSSLIPLGLILLFLPRKMQEIGLTRAMFACGVGFGIGALIFVVQLWSNKLHSTERVFVVSKILYYLVFLVLITVGVCPLEKADENIIMLGFLTFGIAQALGLTVVRCYGKEIKWSS